MTTELPRYVLITPARNEAAFIEVTIRSVINQTMRPLKWVIVSDGSTDGTDEIVGKYLETCDWIEFVRMDSRKDRNFAGKIAAFNAGYARTAALEYDVIGNLDGDISFGSDYLAFLIGKFAENPKLGVAGTPYREDGGIHDYRFRNPTHVSGACQLFRRDCFEQIGGYPAIRSGGVDFIALLRAQFIGWQTMRFDERECFHHRHVGSGQHSGMLSRLLNLGRKDYLLGSHPLFELFRAILQMKHPPFVLGGILMIVGYFWALVTGVKRTMPADLIKFRQQDQIERLKHVFRHPFATRHGLANPPNITARTS